MNVCMVQYIHKSIGNQLPATLLLIKVKVRLELIFANFNAAIFKKVLKLRGNSRRYAYTCTNIMLCVYNSFYASLSYETAKSINVKKLQNFCQLVHNWRPTKNSV